MDFAVQYPHPELIKLHFGIYAAPTEGCYETNDQEPRYIHIQAPLRRQSQPLKSNLRIERQQLHDEMMRSCTPGVLLARSIA